MIEFSQIKEIDNEYFDQGMEIYNLAFPDNEKLSITVLKENIKKNKLLLFVGCENFKVVFMAILCPLLNTNFILLAYVATSENYRGKGIGKKFMKYLAIELEKQRQFLLLEVENPALGNNRELKQRRVSFYQRLGAKTLENVRYLIPKLSEENAPEMILMVYPSYPQNWVGGSLVKTLINSIYEHLYQQPSHPNLEFLCKNMSNKINLV